jgi:predicted AlkP superfamily pyrophosphatase or phosphodiesterase
MRGRTPLSTLALALLAACQGPAPGAPPAAADRHVVLISVDGLAAFYLNDPKADMPTIRRLAAQGAAAEGMLCSFPTVTWPNHTTLVTGVGPGRHGVFGNSYFDRQKQEVVRLIPDPHFDKDEFVKAPTVYDVAHRAGLKTAGIIWPASRNAKTLDWTVPDCMTKELWDKYGTASWLDELRREGIPVDLQETWCKAPGGGVQRDWMYARMTAQVIRKHRPRLVLLHLVEADHVQHAKGPRTPDAYWVCSYIDDRVRDVVEAVDAAGLRDRTAFFIVSDHGFMGYTKSVNLNVRLKKEGLIRLEGDKVASRQAFAVTQGGAAFVYVLDADRRAEIIARLKTIFAELEGVKAVFDEREFEKLGHVPPSRDPREPDLLLAPKDGYTFDGKTAGDAVVEEGPLKGVHGQLPDDPQMHAIFVASGAGIRPGARLGLVRSVDVAPTAARLLGLRMENVEGRVLEEILR